MSALNVEKIHRKSTEALFNQFFSNLCGNKVRFSAACFGLSALANACNFGDPGVVSFATGATCVHLGHSICNAYKDAALFAKKYKLEMLYNTPEYKRCKDLYDEFIRELARFMNDMGVNDTLDIGALFMELLYCGYLSVPGRFEYHRYDIDNDICSDIMGARVLSGSGVCRHIAGCLIDLYKAMGYPAAYVTVVTTNNELSSVIKDKILPFRTNHAVVLVADKYGKYIFDPTHMDVAVLNEQGDFARVVQNEKKLYHIDMDDSTLKFAPSMSSDYAELQRFRPSQISERDVVDSRLNASRFIKRYSYLCNSLRSRIMYYLQNAAMLEHQLSDYSDKKNVYTGKRLTKKGR